MKKNINFDPKLDLFFERRVDVKPEQIWRGWTQPNQLKKWFCPRPWKVVECEINLTPGGLFRTVFQSPEGNLIPNLGSYLEIVENKKLVWTNALLPGYRPAPKIESPVDFFFSAMILLELNDKGTNYSAMAIHSNENDRNKHEAMGFQEGWGKALDQLLEVIKNDFV